MVLIVEIVLMVEMVTIQTLISHRHTPVKYPEDLAGQAQTFSLADMAEGHESAVFCSLYGLDR
jgi:hypothetical protein